MESKTGSEKLLFLGTGAFLISSQSFAGIINSDFNQALDHESPYLNGHSGTVNYYFDIDGDGSQDIRVYESRADYDRTYNSYRDTTPCSSSSYYCNTSRDAYERNSYTESYDWDRIFLSAQNSLWSFALMPIADGARIDAGVSSWTSYANLVDDYYRSGYSYNYRYGDAYRSTCGSGKNTYGCNRVNWEAWQNYSYSGYERDTGSWKDQLDSSMQDFYVGVRKTNDDGSHNYGWLSMSLNEDGYGSVNAAAFNTASDQYLNAGQIELNEDQKVSNDTTSIPEPVSLGLFGLGLAGLASRRKLLNG